jgi:hypothetical protein
MHGCELIREFEEHSIYPFPHYLVFGMSLVQRRLDAAR